MSAQENLTGAGLIAAERERQIDEEGWDAEHDDVHMRGSLARAAACYALSSIRGNIKGFGAIRKRLWTWAPKWWKPKSPIRDLIRAGALCAAEIDRRLRAGEKVED